MEGSGLHYLNAHRGSGLTCQALDALRQQQSCGVHSVHTQATASLVQAVAAWAN